VLSPTSRPQSHTNSLAGTGAATRVDVEIRMFYTRYIYLALQCIPPMSKPYSLVLYLPIESAKAHAFVRAAAPDLSCP
jgi:hypothetical protein